MLLSARCSARSSAIRLVKVVTMTLSPFLVRCLIVSMRWGIWFSVGFISIVGSSSPVGLTNCSAILALPDFSSSYLFGVADTYTVFCVLFWNSGNFSGRLSIADGRRKPYSTRVLFLEWSPVYILLNWGMEMWDSSMMVRNSPLEAKKASKAYGGSPAFLKSRWRE